MLLPKEHREDVWNDAARLVNSGDLKTWFGNILVANDLC